MEEKKSYYSQAQNRATQKYIKENLEEVKFRVRKGEKQRYKDAAQTAGLSMAQFFITAADEKIVNDQLYAGREKADISRFYGITIKMFPTADREEPQVHAVKDETSAVFDVESAEMVDGDMEERAKEFISEWIKLHQGELIDMWNSNSVKRLPPLE